MNSINVALCQLAVQMCPGGRSDILALHIANIFYLVCTRGITFVCMFGVVSEVADDCVGQQVHRFFFPSKLQSDAPCTLPCH